MTHIEKQTLRDLHRPGWRGAFFVLNVGTVYYALVAATVWCLAEEWYGPVALL
ncbi:MAG: hypothetical protein JNK93_01005, partial [Planctomycetia bacterium]|nr:hypothetical protein [Planctomycetia bacterium]